MIKKTKKLLFQWKEEGAQDIKVGQEKAYPNLDQG